MKSILKKRTVVGIVITLALSLSANLLALALPRVASENLNKIFLGSLDLWEFQRIYLGYVALILLATIGQIIISNLATEDLAATIRSKLIQKISQLSYSTVNQITSSKLLTIITSDVDAVKNLFNQGIVQIFSSIVLLIGASIAMLAINSQLGLIVVATIPALFITFGFIFSSISKSFKKAQENLDKLNRVINESIVGAALTKVLNSGYVEMIKFHEVNEVTRQTNLKIVYGFASLIPVISILANLATLAVVYFGGSGVIDFINSQGGSGLSPGDYSAFFSYIGTFLGPIFILGFVASTIARSFTSVKRIQETLAAQDAATRGNVKKEIKGAIKFDKVSLEIANKNILKEISFEIKPGTKNAIVGPTAAGKTQIFNLIAGLQEPTAGSIEVDGTNIKEIDINDFYSQVALVFQDSVIFNTTVKENILFNAETNQADLDKAIATAELSDFIAAQDKGVDTLITERGSSLSGGQKQRLTLARALSINPKILLLDDFTARVDIKTEKNIINNLEKNYPELTLLSITQKIESVKDYDQILLIMEGELIAKGTHKELLKNSFEYQQIFNSQQTTE